MAALLCAFCLLGVFASPAFADDPCQTNGHGHDNGNPCHEVPESSHAVLYAGAGVLVVVGFATYARRRSRGHAHGAA
jgi:hypothetical protein